MGEDRIEIRFVAQDFHRFGDGPWGWTLGGPSSSGRKAKRRTLHTAFAATVIAACAALPVPLREALVLGRSNRAAIEAAGSSTHGLSASQVRSLHRDLPAWPSFLLEWEVSARRR